MERTNITALARKWGVSRRAVYNAAEEGRIPGAEFIDGKWYIPKDAKNPIKRLLMPGYISARDAAEKWGVAHGAVCRAAKKGRIPGAKYIGDRWHIPKDSESPIKIVIDPKPGYISTKEAAEKWGVAQTAVCDVAKEGRIPEAEFLGGRWHIPENVKCPIKRRKNGKIPEYTEIQTDDGENTWSTQQSRKQRKSGV